MHRSSSGLLHAGLMVLAAGTFAGARAADLGIQDSRFTVDGTPTFLLGISYYGALGASEDFIRQDLDDLRRHGFNWIRVWATWAAFGNDVSAVAPDGSAREPFLGQLTSLVAECDRRGLVVDVTLSRGNGITGPSRLQALAAHERAVETLVTALKPYRNWYLDLANERNIADQRFVSITELGQLRDAAKRRDPQRLITASHAGGDLAQADVRPYLVEARLDFLSPHRPRARDSAAQTAAKTVEALGWLRQLGRLVPVHYQEPFRRAYSGWQPAVTDFATDLASAKAGGAAGWCFHNGDARGRPDNEPRRSFDLRRRRLFDQFDEVERAFLATLQRPPDEARPALAVRPWPQAAPAAVHLDADRLRAFSELVGGRGCVVRQGHLAYTWGDAAQPGDVASAVKPVFAHFLFKALADGRVAALDESAVRWEPRLAELNPALDRKDREITWRHFANQTSCYGLAERPGTAFCYNDWQMALFADLLFGGVYGAPWEAVDARVLQPLLTDGLGCEDQPSLVAFGVGDRAGRLGISPRDFARFGQLYLQRGVWDGRPLLREDLAVMAVSTPLPASLPRAGNTVAEMLPQQRTLGSQRVPDNQTDHFGSYSWLWWVNGVERGGGRHWPDAPTNTFAALGHGGMRGLVVMPSLDLVASWNDARVNSPEKENEAFRALVNCALPTPAGSRAPDRDNEPRASQRETGGGAFRRDNGARAFEPAPTPSRLRLLIETDAGGDPDDEQSLVRFLLYASEWDLEGIIANRPQARDRENRNPERTGLGILHRLLEAYGECHPNLVQHDPRYPTRDQLQSRTVAGYDDTEAGVNLLIASVDKPDPRPLWYSDWGTDHGAATNNLQRALDRVRRERGASGYAQFKSRLRLASYDRFGAHTTSLEPPFPLWVDTFRPELDGRRWYHRFSALTARAGGFDLVRDCLTGHGPLGARYPTNTTHGQKEGDTMTFLYLVPTGMNDPEHPQWGSWAGRYGPNPEVTGRRYFWANQLDDWNGAISRDNTLWRWAADLQNDFKARLDWCVRPRNEANHPPTARLVARGGDAPAESAPNPAVPSQRDASETMPGIAQVEAQSGSHVRGDARASFDRDGDALGYEWFLYAEAGTYRGPIVWVSEGPLLQITAPPVSGPETVHFIVRVTDQGEPPLSRYRRLVVTVVP